MTTAVLPARIRQARAYLQQAGYRTADIPPKKFASAAAETGMSFGALLNYLALLMSGGSGEGPSPIATANKDRLNPLRAIGKPAPSQATALDVATGEDGQ